MLATWCHQAFREHCCSRKVESLPGLFTVKITTPRHDQPSLSKGQISQNFLHSFPWAWGTAYGETVRSPLVASISSGLTGPSERNSIAMLESKDSLKNHETSSSKLDWEKRQGNTHVQEASYDENINTIEKKHTAMKAHGNRFLCRTKATTMTSKQLRTLQALHLKHWWKLVLAGAREHTSVTHSSDEAFFWGHVFSWSGESRWLPR